MNLQKIFLLWLPLLAIIVTSCAVDGWVPYVPITFVAGPDVPEEKKEIILDAIIAWNSALGKTYIYWNGTCQYKSINTSDTINVIDWKANLLNPAASGRAYWNSGSCDIAINAYDFGLPRENEDGSITVTNLGDGLLQATLVHEIGHCLGLDHSKDPNDIMFKYLTYVRVPSENDVRRARESLGLPKPGGLGGE